MSKSPAPPSWHQAWLWWGIYPAASLMDYGLTTYALVTRRMGFTPGGPYEANPVAVWLFIHQGGVSVLAYKGSAVVMGAILLVVVRPMWSNPFVRRVVLGLLVAAVVWEIVDVFSVALVLAGG